MENMEKLRFSSCFTPRAARWSSSAIVLLRRFCPLPTETRRMASILTISIVHSVENEVKNYESNMCLTAYLDLKSREK